MINYWNKPGTPHKGWKYIESYDRNATSNSLPDCCEMCKKRGIQYIHKMEHPDYERPLYVGIVCARKMTEDYSRAEAAERKLRNKSDRGQYQLAA